MVYRVAGEAKSAVLRQRPGPGYARAVTRGARSAPRAHVRVGKLPLPSWCPIESVLKRTLRHLADIGDVITREPRRTKPSLGIARAPGSASCQCRSFRTASCQVVSAITQSAQTLTATRIAASSEPTDSKHAPHFARASQSGKGSSPNNSCRPNNTLQPTAAASGGGASVPRVLAAAAECER